MAEMLAKYCKNVGTQVARLPCLLVAIAFLSVVGGCAAQSERGVADKRSNFEKFLPMESDPSHYGLKAVKPFFKSARRTEVLGAIGRACQGSKKGSSIFDPRSGAGYYVNCNPENRQLLNGYVPSNPKVRPRS